VKGVDLVIAFDPEYVRQFAALASFEYPAVAEQELYKGWSKVAVWPQLWEYATSTLKTGRGVFATPDDMVEFLLDLADKEARKVDPDRIKHRARKLVMDFLREMHAYSLLDHSGGFHYVSYQRILDFQYNIDFEVLPKEQQSPVGIQTAMRKDWKADTWRQIHEARRSRRGAKDWKGPIFWMTNRRIAAEKLPNKLWLFKMYHVQEVILEIKGQIKEFNIPKKGTCPACGSSDWWWRPASGLGGPGGWVCGRCHPNPNKEPS